MNLVVSLRVFGIVVTLISLLLNQLIGEGDTEIL